MEKEKKVKEKVPLYLTEEGETFSPEEEKKDEDFEDKKHYGGYLWDWKKKKFVPKKLF